MEDDKSKVTKKTKKDKKKEGGSDISMPAVGDVESEQLKTKKDQIKGEKKLEKKKEKEEKKKLKEEERQKEREEKLKEKEDKRKAEKKRELRKEQRKSWLAKNSGGSFPLDPESVVEPTEVKDKKTPKPAQSQDVMRRQRELEQFLLNMPIKRLRGTTWQYYDIAPATGYTETMIVLHGGGIRPEGMYEYILGLAQGFRVVAPRFPEVFTEIDDYVAGVFLIMRHENIKKSHFFGLGFGSVVALHCLYRHPARVMNCILAHCSLPGENKIRHVEKALRKMEFNNGPLRRLMAGSMVKAKDIEEHVFDLSLGERDMWVRNFKNFGATKQAVFSRLETLLDYHTNCSYTQNDFERWEGKMLLIESEDDEYFDIENFASLKSLFPTAVQHCISSCGHLYSLIRGKQVTDVILRFVLDEDAYKDVTSKTDISPHESPRGDGEESPVFKNDQSQEQKATHDDEETVVVDVSKKQKEKKKEKHIKDEDKQSEVPDDKEKLVAEKPKDKKKNKEEEKKLSDSNEDLAASPDVSKKQKDKKKESNVDSEEKEKKKKKKEKK